MERSHGAVVPAVDLAVDAIIELMLLRVRRERVADPHHVGDGVLIGGNFPSETNEQMAAPSAQDSCVWIRETGRPNMFAVIWQISSLRLPPPPR